MTTLALKLIAPLESPVPPPPSGDVLTDSQWATLMAIADTVIPSIGDASQPAPDRLSIESTEYATVVKKIEADITQSEKADLAQKYLQESPSTLPGFKQFLHRVLADYMREDARKGLRIMLSALE